MTTPHFLQSAAWEKFQNNLGRKTIRRQGDGWSYMAIVEQSSGVKRLYCPYGPTADSSATLENALESLQAEAQTLGAHFVRVQPLGYMLSSETAQQLGLRPVEYSQPVSTQVIDLRPPMEEIIQGISSRKRSIYRNYAKKGLQYSISHSVEDMDKLMPLLREVEQRNGVTFHGDHYLLTQAKTLLPDSASLHFMTYDDVVVAAVLLFEDDTTGYYAHVGNTAEHRNLSAGTALVGEILRYLKEHNKQSFDFYGIAPTDDPAHPWAGISVFKQSFGGSRVMYNQTYDLPISPLFYTLYTWARKLRRNA